MALEQNMPKVAFDKNEDLYFYFTIIVLHCMFTITKQESM